MKTDQLGRLRDILDAAQRIASYVQDVSEADFLANTEKQDAIIRRLEIIGEAAIHLTEETRRTITGKVRLRLSTGTRPGLRSIHMDRDPYGRWRVLRRAALGFIF
jgi:uncharacterized protein with HEPN domain